MTDTASRAGGRPPGNGTSYNPIAGADCLPGAPLCQSQDDDGTVLPADADAEETSYVVGLAAGAGVLGNSVLTQFGGVLTLTTAEWDAITGDTGGLELNTQYFLSTTAGRLTSSTIFGSGDFITPVGLGLSATDMLIRPGFPREV